ncbi:putative PadR-like family transcriptional regulator [Actinoplanes missouriensis 431]|uniref:Putative PadR-like family transcriptional regulator n=1 Tax=Actinoplanes missouriensis (strain ATCC 14538 / DSM 43046 / CBS 188.64 / JCM 3121 / NBRC 102363 / NCIMB 12654 / NRRL B-3342 / UNCC 431) TaxID=512565 RepID=I0H9P3_ACTM4|nr:helix-turn-helix transcriptional regulator [Actinoplanes missouriensis]BAL89730.1 putative PadR-like family transcriptional regulator [Actinoplanes missouriensis 431]
MDVKGHLDLLLLAVLADAGSAHGYAVITALRERSRGAFDVPEGTVYPALHRLERAGLVVSRWEQASPRRRRVYELTREGRLARAAKQSEWRSFVTSVQAVIGPVAGSATA